MLLEKLDDQLQRVGRSAVSAWVAGFANKPANPEKIKVRILVSPSGSAGQSRQTGLRMGSALRPVLPVPAIIIDQSPNSSRG
jgi:hypothetical protein